MGCKLDFFCGYFSYNSQPGIELSSDLLIEMGELSIDFGVCFYKLY
jgi:hypothetical protein